MRRAMVAAFSLLLAQGLSFAQKSSAEYLSFLSDAQRKSLADTGEVGGFGARAQDLALWQKAPFAEAVRAVLPDQPGGIAAEALFLVDPPKGDSKDMGLRVIRAFTAFSSMKGLQVYSSSRRKMETFIYDSWRIDGLAERKALPDPVFDAAPSRFECMIYQKEEQTGDVYSALSFDAKDGRYLVKLNNLTELRYLFFQLVGPKMLSTIFVVEPTKDKIVLYGLTVAATPRFLGLERLKQSSFFNRMKALATWFSANLARQ